MGENASPSEAVELVVANKVVDADDPLPVAVIGGSGSGAQPVSIADGADVTLGAKADTAVTTDANGSVSAKLRGLVKMVNSVLDSTLNALKTRPANGSLTDRSSTITTGGTAQNAMASNSARAYLLLRNPVTATEPLYFDLTAAAVTTGSPSIRLNPGDTFVMEGSFVSTQALSVNAATTGHAFTAKEG